MKSNAIKCALVFMVCGTWPLLLFGFDALRLMPAFGLIALLSGTIVGFASAKPRKYRQAWFLVWCALYWVFHFIFFASSFAIAFGADLLKGLLSGLVFGPIILVMLFPLWFLLSATTALILEKWTRPSQAALSCIL